MFDAVAGRPPIIWWTIIFCMTAIIFLAGIQSKAQLVDGAVGAVANTTSAEAPATGASAVKKKEAPRQLREGTKIDTIGFFKISGDRATFYVADEPMRLMSLENLALDRVMGVIGNAPARKMIYWHVRGTVTEYHGNNFLLVERAVMRAQPAGGHDKLTRSDASPQRRRVTAEQ